MTPPRLDFWLSPSRWRSRPVGYVAAFGAVAIVSLFIGLVLGQVNLANISMLYLLAVMATAVGFGRGPAVFASLSAFLIFDWFFVEPIHQFTVSDPEEWVSLLFFLLTATAKYSPANGDINVTATRGPDVSVAIEDRGPGIPAAAAPHLFDPFYRVSDGRPRPQGLGLGLAIVKGLVEAHGGRVWAENRAGGGARFTFTLPASAAPAAPVNEEVPQT